MGALNKKQIRYGFTLLELLIVIGIISVLAAALFIALNPAQRFQDSRNARRWSDVRALMSAIKIDQVDNQGVYFSALATSAVAGTTYQISNNPGFGPLTPIVTCNTNCPAVTGAATCLNFNSTNTDDLIDEGDIASIPYAPPTNTVTWSGLYTGYYITKSSVATGSSTTIGSCVVEGTPVTISQ
ncbi:hypothetical protein A3I40_04335 [Candidatus Uhrbacteria bacterium RIFCSPLOWO2_02_FULL_48_12]|uniref:Type II secretion system protein GspG C-terminal domain-containing protein n=1 Tax=Candidatus Uhrbacteria bacterium RIFCSPLOWO2_02_FULL_48_12 TaxID=1802407 RepID=A0A1F7VAE5_9BACT|nr:MAG: hypothetical protein A3I40_04335 [Candidatus Uhrbacteria bacterium RIFCSPLOWO2_02_FULL_48_12]